MFGERTARALDDLARGLAVAGELVAGDVGGRAGEWVANSALGRLRDRCDVPCTCPDCGPA